MQSELTERFRISHEVYPIPVDLDPIQQDIQVPLREGPVPVEEALGELRLNPGQALFLQQIGRQLLRFPALLQLCLKHIFPALQLLQPVGDEIQPE